MNYLDQLKQEAEQRKAQELANQQLCKQQEERFLAEIKPALECSYNYLQELTRQLNYLKPNTPVAYEIKGCGKLDLLQQQDYRVLTHDQNEAHYKSYDSQGKSRKEFSASRYNFFLRCHCVGPYKIRVEKRKPREMNELKEYLVRHSLKFTCTEETDRRHQFLKAVFMVEPMIPVEFNFTGNLATCTIELTVKNFPELGDQVYILAPQAIDTTFLNELAKYVTRQPNTLSLPVKEQWKKSPLSPQQKDHLQFEVWLHNAQRELGEHHALEKLKANSTNDLDEFEEWLRHQEAHLAKSQEESRNQPPMFFQLLKKVKLFKGL